MTTKYKKGIDREKQLDLITKHARIMFAIDTSMSMQELAKKVGLRGASSLYRYIDSKRELWFAVIIKDFEVFTTKMQSIIDDPENVSYLQILRQMCETYLKFSREEFSGFKVMFLMEPPGPIPKTESEKGIFERSHQPKGFEIFMRVVQKGQKAGEITKREDPFMLTGIVWSILLGAATAISPLYNYLGEGFFSRTRSGTQGDPRLLYHEKAIEIIIQLVEP